MLGSWETPGAFRRCLVRNNQALRGTRGIQEHSSRDQTSCSEETHGDSWGPLGIPGAGAPNLIGLPSAGTIYLPASLGATRHSGPDPISPSASRSLSFGFIGGHQARAPCSDRPAQRRKILSPIALRVTKQAPAPRLRSSLPSAGQAGSSANDRNDFGASLASDSKDTLERDAEQEAQGSKSSRPPCQSLCRP